MILLIVSLHSVLIERFVVADTAFDMFLARVDHICEMLSILMNLDDALGGMVCCCICASRIVV